MSDFECDICGKDCGNAVSLIMHVTKEHPQQMFEWSSNLGKDDSRKEENEPNT